MNNEGQMIFEVNELVAIHAALQSQIEDCEDFLSDKTLHKSAKLQISQSLKYSKSALSRLEAIFAENNINPQKT